MDRNDAGRMRIDAEAIKDNFAHLAEHERLLSERVYHHLFTAHPELLDLFTSQNSPASAQMVRETIMYAIDHVNGASWVGSNLASLGAKHVDYEVTEPMYGLYVEAMLAAMAELSGAEWTAKLESGWRELLQYLADLMIAELPDVDRDAGPETLGGR